MIRTKASARCHCVRAICTIWNVCRDQRFLPHLRATKSFRDRAQVSVSHSKPVMCLQKCCWCTRLTRVGLWGLRTGLLYYRTYSPNACKLVKAVASTAATRSLRGAVARKLASRFLNLLISLLLVLNLNTWNLPPWSLYNLVNKRRRRVKDAPRTHSSSPSALRHLLHVTTVNTLDGLVCV